jgi:GNAT superfamily N-acetyltransferase
MIEYSIVGFTEAWPQIRNLVKSQWGEVDHRAVESHLDVMEQTYTNMEDLGLHYVVLATEDKEVFGYDSMMITENPHTSELTALTDTMYISPEKRKAGLGREMIKVAEEEAVRRGALRMCIVLKNNQRHEDLVDGLGYFSYETIYSKYLKD